MKYIVVYGGAADWHKSLGPFETYDQAYSAAERIRETHWLITQIEDPHEQADKS